ncbi:hypothetical protein GCM10017673_19820 [Streptosporangium violaceochromogenes]|nr:hypothetical protein GCM10017673_19820 [Streptosporangium violaceochromogenes]
MSLDDLPRSGAARHIPCGAARRAPEAAERSAPGGVDVAAGARELVAGLLAEPWGRVSASPYETGRLVSMAPWLGGHARRVGFLLETQRPDGGWGPPEGYALVPTLSATEALLAELRRGAPDLPGTPGRPGVSDVPAAPGEGRAAVAGAARRGLAALRRWARGLRDLPDLPAIELIAPALTAMINGHLEAAGDGEPLKPPAGMNDAKLSAIRALLASGAAVPRKLLHALEVAGETAAGAAGVAPTPMDGAAGGKPPSREGAGGAPAGRGGGAPAAIAAVGASPAAGAAWLGPAGGPGSAVRRYLEAVVERSGGPVPCALPITLFERGWTLSWLRRAGVPVTVPRELVASLEAAAVPGGAAAGPGLPPDSDTTSVGLYALALLGEPREPAGLWAYETGTHFCTWRGEEGASPTVNAHVLDAFGEYARCRGGTADVSRYTAAAVRLSAWLRERQRADGSWLDRWHASPYYATACCALALRDHGGRESEGAVRAAVRWLLDTQREDGSWGRWEGTAEETAYALQTLLLAGAPAGTSGGTRAGAWETAGPSDDGRRAAAVAHGYRCLRECVTERGHPAGAPALWHDKDLYFPAAIVTAAVLGALHLARRALSAGGAGVPATLSNGASTLSNRALGGPPGRCHRD